MKNSEADRQIFDGQIYHRLGVEPYTNVRGFQIELVVLATDCRFCGKMFVTKHSSFKKFNPTRNCPDHHYKRGKVECRPSMT